VNSVLQLLYHASDFKLQMYNFMSQERTTVNNKEHQIWLAITSLFVNLDHSKNRSVDPMQILNSIEEFGEEIKRECKGSAFLFMDKILKRLQCETTKTQTFSIFEEDSKMEDEWAEFNMFRTSPIVSSFYGLMANKLVCQNTNCNYYEQTLVPFWHLEINYKISSKRRDIKEYLDKYFSATNSKKANICSHCGCESHFKRFKSLIHMPKFLVLKLEAASKGFNDISIPTTGLRISNYCNESQGSEGLDVNYDIAGMISQTGRSSNKQYYSNSRTSNGDWYLLNDEEIKWITQPSTAKYAEILLFKRRELLPNDDL